MYAELRPVAYAGHVVYQKFPITVWGGGVETNTRYCSYYGTILIFDNYGRPLILRVFKTKYVKPAEYILS